MNRIGTLIGLGANAALTLVATLAFPGCVLVPAGFFVGWLLVWRAEVRR